MNRKMPVMLLLMLLIFPIQSFAKELIPMGNSIGVQLQMPYVFVSHDVLLESGDWLKQGDRITSLNNKELTDLNTLFQQKDDVELTVEKEGKKRKITVSKDQLAHLRPFLKSETDGIGTLTFIDPDTLEYGALGHQIMDSVLKQPPAFYDGAIFEASISQVKKSVPGQPGYKVSIVDKSLSPLGTVLSNDIYGIFGKWEQPLHQSLHQPLEIIHAEQLKEGKAELLTSINGEKVESFEIKIEKNEGNTFTFHVTDKRLIQQTGGIVQGMSGSPILQDNQFVGAVTHMFVEEPTKGAGILLVEMLKKSPN
ncbi:SpoIVB peptidase S55 domain-containing protein [Solibacillus sp. FSL R7-0682]|uniref:SpoIVB peptidase S55 domain-containing protein n=1 Tax=Solibacillus sp. FSL R7-0682 TaxID=2921690 RepID=UPI0030F9802E